MTDRHPLVVLTAEFTFREYLNMMAKPRGVADNGVERRGVLSRSLREFVRAAPPDHNCEDLLAVVADDLADELRRIGDLYALMTQSDATVIREALRLVPPLRQRRRRRRTPPRKPTD